MVADVSQSVIGISVLIAPFKVAGILDPFELVTGREAKRLAPDITCQQIRNRPELRLDALSLVCTYELLLNSS